MTLSPSVEDLVLGHVLDNRRRGRGGGEGAASRLATLEAVRDGRMIPVYAAVSVTGDEGWIAHGLRGIDPTDGDVLDHLEHGTGDALTILHGYAHVPSAQVHEVEADYEVTS